MNKSELVNAIAESANITRTKAEQALAGFCKAVEKSLAAGESTAFIGFGTFSAVSRAARTGRNPQTGKQIEIPAKTVVKFKPGKRLSEALG